VLSSGVLKFAGAGGRIRNTLTAPTIWNAGAPFAAGVLSANTVGAITKHHDGMPYIATGQLATEAAAPVVFSQGPIPISAAGRICVDTAGAVAFWNAGLPYTAAGRLAFNAAE
jgi:hypothetical protein